MKRKIVFRILVCFIGFGSLVYGAEIPAGYTYAITPPLSITFLKNNKVLFEDLEKDKANWKTIYDYKLEYKSGVPFITIFNSKNPKTYLFLYNKNFCAFYEKDGSIYQSGISILNRMESFYTDGWISKDESIYATKEVIEGEVKYAAENIVSRKIDEVWAAPNNGINESIIINQSTYDDDNVSKENYDGEDILMICSGFISYTKPYLYKDNARPKKIKVTLSNFQKKILNEYIFDLKDTPHPQSLRFKESLNNKIIMLTILDVYKGEKYSDVCISKIWAYGGPTLQW